jgi:hypothetical protein
MPISRRPFLLALAASVPAVRLVRMMEDGTLCS